MDKKAAHLSGAPKAEPALLDPADPSAVAGVSEIPAPVFSQCILNLNKKDSSSGALEKNT